MPKSIKVYLDDIQESIRKIEEYTKGYDFEKFIKDGKTIDAVIRNFSIIGEAANRVPKEIQEKNPKIPWFEMIGTRNKAIHEYSGINTEIIWKTIQEDLPKLKGQLKDLFRKIN
ncbi:DUF86 domain-containing protein [Patescibacteria group bacterium]